MNSIKNNLHINAIIVSIFLVLLCNTSVAQWIPVVQLQGVPIDIAFEPACNSNRRQIHVRLVDDTKFATFFKPAIDLKGGSVLYKVKFKLSYQNIRNDGNAYCEPFTQIKLDLDAGYRDKNLWNGAAKNGFTQCFFDFDSDGMFDENSGPLPAYFPHQVKTSTEHHYKYEEISNEGPPEGGCPRPAPSMNAIVINEGVWSKLSSPEQKFLKDKGTVEVIPSNEVGIVVQSEKLNKSTLGSNSGSILGEQIGAANYIDKSISNGGYSAKGQLGAQLVGAIIGGAFDTKANSEFRTRYTVKMTSGEIFTSEKSSYKDSFSIANGICVYYPSLEQADPSLCESTLDFIRNKYIPVEHQLQVVTFPKEVKLRELKDLYDKGLVSEKAYTEQQKLILNN